VPLAAGIFTLAALPFTIGASTIALPLISLALTMFAVRRTTSSRDFVVRLGLTANALVGVVLIASVAIILHDHLAG